MPNYSNIWLYPHPPLKTLGIFKARVESKHQLDVAEFYMVKGSKWSLIISQTTVDIGVIKFMLEC